MGQFNKWIMGLFIATAKTVGKHMIFTKWKIMEGGVQEREIEFNTIIQSTDEHQGL